MPRWPVMPCCPVPLRPGDTRCPRRARWAGTPLRPGRPLRTRGPLRTRRAWRAGRTRRALSARRAGATPGGARGATGPGRASRAGGATGPLTATRHLQAVLPRFPRIALRRRLDDTHVAVRVRDTERPGREADLIPLNGPRDRAPCPDARPVNVSAPKRAIAAISSGIGGSGWTRAPARGRTQKTPPSAERVKRRCYRDGSRTR